MRDADDDPTGAEAPGPQQGLAWRLMGVAFLALAGLLVVRALPAPEVARAEPPGALAERVAAWEATLPAELGGGTVRLRRLHADEARQRFDAEALSRVLERPGAPWRLELPGDMEPNAAGGDAAGGDSAGASDGTSRAGSPLSARVELEGGVLESVAAGEDPLTRLLARTATSGSRVLFGPGEPSEPVLVLGGTRLVLAPVELGVPRDEEPLLREEQP
ncbi:MAG: hypothetical protein ISQ08_10890 [Planctomycetes bacterium]|nr:hypothetical protein [Planctomycetota bacterium]